MMRHLRFVCHAAVLIGVFAVSGCAIGGSTPPSRFYLLAPLEAVVDAAGGPSLGLGPIRLAQYLDRPQIVTRRSPHRLALAEFDRWGEPLSESISRVLAANLSALLRTSHVQRHPWRDGRGIELRVELDVRRFDGPLRGPVELVVHWRASRRDSQVARISRYSEPLDAEGYEPLAAAMSRALQALSVDIANAVTALEL